MKCKKLLVAFAYGFLVFQAYQLVIMMLSINCTLRLTPNVPFGSLFCLPRWEDGAVVPVVGGEGENDVPEWIDSYFAWHREMRHKFPDRQLFEHPDAPNLIVRVCTLKCGGLNDRITGLPLDLYVANLTRRVLLVKWTHPMALEEFMVPSKVDWTVPSGVGFDTAKQINSIPSFTFYRGGGQMVIDAVENALTGDLSTTKVFTSSCLAGNVLMESLNVPPAFGYIFNSFFKPSPRVRTIMNEIVSKYNLRNGMYTAVHCRVRHPKGVPRCQGLAGREGGQADSSGISFQQNFTLGHCHPNETGLLFGRYMDFAVNIATHAIDCAHYISQNVSDAIYLFSDSNDTLAFMTGEESPFAGSGVSIASSYSPAVNVLHIDRQPGHKASDYYPVFVDLFLAAKAKCVSYGVGNYGLLAAKISGTKCKIQHRDFIWETGPIPESRKGSQCPPSPHRANWTMIRKQRK